MKYVLPFVALLLLPTCSPSPPQPRPPNPIQAFNAAEAQIKGDKSCWEKLRQAAAANDLRQIKYLIEHGCVIDGQKKRLPYNSPTVVRMAVQQPTLDMLEWLLARGLDPCYKRYGGRSALFLAAESGTLAALDLLIEHCDDLDEAGGRYGMTPLTIAVENERIEQVIRLLDSGASIEPDSLSYRGSPLNKAVESHNIQLIKLLLDRGADVNTRFSASSASDCIVCMEGVTALHTAVGLYEPYSEYRRAPKQVADEILELLVARGGDLNLGNDQDLTPLEHACYGTDTALVSKLIKLGAKLETQGYSALHCAAQFSNTLMVAHLLKLGADPNVKTQSGETPLVVSFYCCGDGFGEGITDEARIATSRLLLRYGADPSLKSLHYDNRSVLSGCKTGCNKVLCEAVFAEYY